MSNPKAMLSPPFKVVSVVGAIVCFLVWLTLKYYGFYPVERDLGPTAEVRFTPFFAAGKLLELNQKEVLHARDLKLLDQASLHTIDSIIIAAQPGHLSTQRFVKLKQWIEDGGHLIYWVNKQGKQNADPILDLLSTELIEDEIAMEDKKVEKLFKIGQDVMPELSELLKTQREPVTLTFNSPNTDIKVAFDPAWYMYDYSEQAETFSEDGIDHLLQYQWGKGKISLVSDMQYWLNPNIAQHDHAYFLQVLIADAQNIHFLYAASHESVLNKLNKLAKPALYGLLLLVFVLIWRAIPRLGPVITLNLHQRRTLDEHINASAKLRWHQGQQQQWLDNLLQEIHKTANLRNPTFLTMNKEQQLDWLSHISELPVEAIEPLYKDDVSQLSEAEFLQLMHNLQILQAKL